MPLYDAKCLECGKEFEHFCSIQEMDSIHCDCGGAAKTLITCNKNKDWFPEGGFWHPNLDVNPVFVKTKSHYKELCKQYNVTPRCMGDVRSREV